MDRRCSADLRSVRCDAFRYQEGVGGMLRFTSKTPVAPTTRGVGTGVPLSEQDGYGPVTVGGVRVLVAFGDEYRAYREAIARALQALRPSTQVTVAPLEAIPAQVYELEPHVVICAGGSDAVSVRDTTWVTVPTEAGVPSSISCGDFYREFGDLSLTELLTVLDRIESSHWTLRDEEHRDRS